MNSHLYPFWDILNTYETPVFFCDLDFHIINVNNYIEKNNINITTGQHIKDVLSSNSIDYADAFDKVLKGLPFLSTDFEYNLLDTTLCMLPLVDESAVTSILCILGISQNNSKAFNNYRNSISPIISERYRSPVAGIMNVSAILARRFQTDEDYKSLEYLNHISHCCYSMLNTSVSVQEYYLLVNQKKEISLKKLVLNNFLENIHKTLQVLFINTDYILELSIADEEKIVTEFDEDMISLAIFHIISNSCKFSAKGSTIKIALSRGNNTANITISDEGIGIDNKVIDRVFDPFFNVTTTPVAEDEIGIGLGLPIAKKIMEAHNGQVFITSEINKGTSLVLSLPIKSDDSVPLTLSSDTAKYMTDKFSNIYLIFSDICDIRLY